MILSDLEIQLNDDKPFPVPRSREVDLSQEPPAKVELFVSLEETELEQACAQCFVAKSEGGKLHETAVVMGLARQASLERPDASGPTWFETARSVLDDRDRFVPVSSALTLEENVNFRVKFSSRLDSKVTGYAFTSLNEVFSAPEGRIRVRLQAETEHFLDGVAVFTARLNKTWTDNCIIEMRIRIEKSAGWPFASTRPFFVLYRWREQVKDWVPIYRSEVISKPSDHPRADGSMYYQIARLQVREYNRSYIDELRIEFFHYKIGRRVKLLGYLDTSLGKLRRAQEGSELPLVVNSFSPDHLVGKLSLRKRQITAPSSYFSLQAEFGGEIPEDCVNFEISLSQNVGHLTPWKSRVWAKFHIEIAALKSDNNWEAVHHTQVPPKLFRNKTLRFLTSRVALSKLNGNDPEKPFRISLKMNNGRCSLLGIMETSLRNLEDANKGRVLSIDLEDKAGIGHARVVQCEMEENTKLVVLECVLGSGPQDVANGAYLKRRPASRTDLGSIGKGKEGQNQVTVEGNLKGGFTLSEKAEHEERTGDDHVGGKVSKFGESGMGVALDQVLCPSL